MDNQPTPETQRSQPAQGFRPPPPIPIQIHMRDYLGTDPFSETSSAVTINKNEVAMDTAPHKLHARTYFVVFTVCVIYFAQLVNLVGAGAQTQQIANALNGSSRAVWISSPLVILTVVLSPMVSQAADYWGRRWFLILLTLCGSIGSCIVSRANSMDTVIAGFTISGFSYGAQPLLHAVVAEVLPRRYRSWGQAADLVANALGGITGLLVGGALNRDGSNIQQPSFGFRNFWYMSTGIYALATILTIFVYHPPASYKQMSMTTSQKLAQLDWIGYGLLTAGLVLFSVGLSYSQNPYPWSDAHVSATFAIGLVALVLLVVYETWFKADGMFHHGLFRKGRNFPLVLACVFCEGIAFFASNQYFAFEVGTLYEQDNLLVAVRYSLSMIASIFSALLAGWYIAATRRLRWVTVLAFVTFVAFFIGMSTSGVHDSARVWGFPVLLGTALSLTLCALITMAQLSTPPELIAITSGLVISIRSFGGAIGLAIYNALFVEGMKHVGDNIANTVVPLGLKPQNVGQFIEAFMARDNKSLFQIPGVTPQIAGAAADSLLNTYATSFQHVWTAAACFVGVATILAIFLRDDKEQFTMEIEAPLELKKSNMYAT